MKKIIKKYKILIYSRISTSEQKINTSIKNQIQSMKQYFILRNYRDIEIFSDIESGSTVKRKSYKKMINKIHILLKQNIKIIVGVYKLDRLHRSLLNLMKFIEFIKNKNIGLVSITENFDLSTPQGKLFMQMLGSFAEFEREIIKERMINGKLYKMKLKKFIGGRLPFGYKYTKQEGITVDKKNKKIVKMVFKLKNQNNSIYKITQIIKKNFPLMKIYYMKIYRIISNKSMYFGTKIQHLLTYKNKIHIKPIINKYYQYNN